MGKGGDKLIRVDVSKIHLPAVVFSIGTPSMGESRREEFIGEVSESCGSSETSTSLRGSFLGACDDADFVSSHVPKLGFAVALSAI